MKVSTDYCNPWRYLVAQLGARMHYAVPRIFESVGALTVLYTDICATTGCSNLFNAIPPSFRTAALRRFLGRVPHGIPKGKIHTFPLFGLRYARRLKYSTNEARRYETNLWAAKRFNKAILQRGLAGANGVYAFNSAGLELLEHAKAQGVFTAVEQTIAPHDLMWRIENEERTQFEDWQNPPTDNPFRAEYTERNRREWAAAQRIICGSEFVRDSIAACGGPAERCRVVPYGYDPEWTPTPRAQHGGPLRVLYAGAVGLRKGAPYVLEAAKRMKGRAEFRLVGSVQVREAAAKQLSEFTDLYGAIPRTEMPSHLQWADVFLLPSLCEGSATVTYEALAAGLPVICTPNTGSVVRDGTDGFIVPVRDVDAIVERIENLANNTDLRRTMGEAAKQRATEYTVARYGERLLDALKVDNPTK